jgi:uncharacterized protein (DUF1778 family)
MYRDLVTPEARTPELTHNVVYGKFPYTETVMTTSARLDLRLSQADKERIARAADLRGVPLSAFVRDAVLREAESVMTAELTVTLSVEESRRFMKAMDAPFRPNAKLKRALERAAKA